MVGGRVRVATLGATLAAVLLVGADARARAEGDWRSAPLLRLEVLLTVSPDLGEPARRTLVTEAARIWRHELVELGWPTAAGGTEPPGAPLRVLVIPRPDAAITGEERWPVAEIIPHDGQRAIAIASIASARRVVNEAARFQLIEHPGHLEYRLGLVLGRAVAHEIGHFLLATSTHADHGLMRASVNAGEFAALDNGTFRLDAGASQWMRERILGETQVSALRTAGFSYARP
jgi:hypothetical protein